MSDTASVGFGLAFVAGLLGSGHCVGMCGGLVTGCFMRLGAAGRRPAIHAAYHGARLTVYAVVGLIAAGLGQVVLQTGRFGFAQGMLQVLAGAVVIVLGLDVFGKLPFAISVGFAPLAWSRQLFVTALERAPVRGALLAGTANGLMPCSLTMAMAFKAAAAADPLQGAALMLAFGAGTLPSMLGVSALFATLSSTARARLVAAAAVLVIGMGIALIIQGLGYTRVMGKLAN
jgi:uncharacterized protein